MIIRDFQLGVFWGALGTLQKEAGLYHIKLVLTDRKKKEEARLPHVPGLFHQIREAGCSLAGL